MGGVIDMKQINISEVIGAVSQALELNRMGDRLARLLEDIGNATKLLLYY